MMLLSVGLLVNVIFILLLPLLKFANASDKTNIQAYYKKISGRISNPFILACSIAVRISRLDWGEFLKLHPLQIQPTEF